MAISYLVAGGDCWRHLSPEATRRERAELEYLRSAGDAADRPYGPQLPRQTVEGRVNTAALALVLDRVVYGVKC